MLFALWKSAPENADSLNVFEQFERLHVEGVGDSNDIEQTDVAFAALNATNVGAVQTAAVGQFFLGDEEAGAGINGRHPATFAWAHTIGLQTISIICLRAKPRRVLSLSSVCRDKVASSTQRLIPRL